jgi:hypothetical protein
MVPAPMNTPNLLCACKTVDDCTIRMPNKMVMRFMMLSLLLQRAFKGLSMYLWPASQNYLEQFR